jgi:hypothetical protein
VDEAFSRGATISFSILKTYQYRRESEFPIMLSQWMMPSHEVIPLDFVYDKHTNAGEIAISHCVKFDIQTINEPT